MESIVRAGLVVLWLLAPVAAWGQADSSAPLRAGAAKVDITNYEAGPVNDPLYARAIVLKGPKTELVLVAVDAVAIGEIGPIKNDYLPTVRKLLKEELSLDPSKLLVNASHCHGIVCSDVAERTVEAVRLAVKNVTPVVVGVGVGHEDRISENRRLLLKSGKEADVRHAYALPADEEVAEVGPIDPQIGLVRFDRKDGGGTVAVIYNFACHPIMSVPGGASTGDITGFSSRVIEDNLGKDSIALFLQGCGGDINPVEYKAVDHPRHAEPLGNMLGLSALKGLRAIECKEDARLAVQSEMLTLPRADQTERIAALEDEQRRLVQSLTGASLNLKTFLPLAVKYNLTEEFPSYASHRYLHEKQLGKSDYEKLDAENRRNLQAYMQNILTMEKLTRVQTNLALLRKHQASLIASGKRTIDVEVLAVRIGEAALVTFPGELTVRIGLGIKQRSPHPRTFVAGYTNGYIYYAPTAQQLKNVGNAQEDSDCILAPEWQAIFEGKAAEMLGKL
jgi:hypothetical protein